MNKKQIKKRKIEFPNTYTMLIIIMIVVGIGTYFIPAGEFSRVISNGKTTVDPTTFTIIESNPIGIFDFFKAIPQGINSSSMLLVMILLTGGAIQVFDSNEAIKKSLIALLKKFGGNNKIIIIALSIFFGTIGAFPSMLEAIIPFAPICVALSLELGYDKLLGISIPLLSLIIGWTAGPTNAWTVGIAHNISGLPMFSGIGFRVLLLIVYLVVVNIFLIRYAKKIERKNDVESNRVLYESVFDKTSKITMIIFAITIVVIIIGTLKFKWSIIEMSSIYIIGAFFAGLVNRYSLNKFTSIYIDGCKSILPAAMAVGLARTIQVLLEQSKISDTIIKFLANFLKNSNPIFTAIGMFFTQGIINIFIPSGSGQAMITLPIMIPLSDIVGISRQIAIIAFQMGDGITNLIFPTMAVTMAFLSFADINFIKWLKFIFPFMIVITLVSIIFLIAAIEINLH